MKKLIKKILKESDWDWANEIKPSDLNPFYKNGVALHIDIKPTLEQAETIFDWAVQAGKTTKELNNINGRARALASGPRGYYMAILDDGHFLWNFDFHRYLEFRAENKLSGELIKLSNILPNKLKEEQLDLFGSVGETKYERCSHFKGNESHRNLCYELYTLGSFLYKDLGLKDIINQKIKLMGEVKDLNDKYQNPLMLLYKTGKFNDIKRENNKFYTDKLVDVSTLYDEGGAWHYVNKLNTNYADLAELLTELFIRGGIANKLTNKNKLGLKKYLSSIKDKLINVLDKYISLDEYKSFIRNAKHLSQKGEQAEDDVRKVLESFGMKTLYTGGHGDFIDMLYGIDLIMDYKGKVYLVQIKNTEDQALKSAEYPRYRKLDYFAAPTNFGIIIKNTDGRITKLNQEGEVINDSE